MYVRAGIPEAFRDRLVPLADIVTPNPFELELLTGHDPTTLESAHAAARALLGRGTRAAGHVVVATGSASRTRPGSSRCWP